MRTTSTSPGLVVVTGGSSGIGLELARCAARDGHPLLLVARGREALEAAAETCRADGAPDVAIVAADIATADGLEAVCGAVDGSPHPLAALVNNAGVGGWGAFAEQDASTVTTMVELNVRALVLLTHRLLPQLRETRGGVLLVASTASFQPGPGMAVYHATKAFVLWFGVALREELRGSGTRVTTLCPGPVRTGFNAAAGLPTFESLRLAKLTETRADDVARAGWRGLARNKAVVVPGVINRVTAVTARLGPLPLVTRIARSALGALDRHPAART